MATILKESTVEAETESFEPRLQLDPTMDEAEVHHMPYYYKFAEGMSSAHPIRVSRGHASPLQPDKIVSLEARFGPIWLCLGTQTRAKVPPMAGPSMDILYAIYWVEDSQPTGQRALLAVLESETVSAT